MARARIYNCWNLVVQSEVIEKTIWLSLQYDPDVEDGILQERMVKIQDDFSLRIEIRQKKNHFYYRNLIDPMKTDVYYYVEIQEIEPHIIRDVRAVVTIETKRLSIRGRNYHPVIILITSREETVRYKIEVRLVVDVPKLDFHDFFIWKWLHHIY